MSQQARDFMLDFVVQSMMAAGVVNIDVETVKASGLLPGDFFPPASPEEDTAEIKAAVNRISSEIEAQSAEAHPEEKIVDGDFTELPQTEPEPDAAPEVEAEQPPAKSLLECTEGLARAQHAAQAALERQKRARHVLADAILKFQIAYGAALTPEELRRQFAASENQKRKMLASGEIEPTRMTRRANTYIDRVNGRGGTADDHVRQNMRTGHRRGAMPSHMQGAFDPRFQRRMPKLPSQK